MIHDINHLLKDDSERFRYNFHFWQHVDVPTRKNPDICWEWMASSFPNGYGQWGPRKFLSHRIAYILYYNKPIEAGNVIMHLCDNRKCCNPHHLQQGTQEDNMQDCIAKGRRKNNIKFLIPNNVFHKIIRGETTTKEAAYIVGCDPSYMYHRVKQFRKKENIDRTDRLKITKEEAKFIKGNFPTMNGVEIAKALGRPRRTIHGWIKRMGLRNHIK